MSGSSATHAVAGSGERSSRRSGWPDVSDLRDSIAELKGAYMVRSVLVQAAQEAAVPFWVQVVSIAVAPILGFVGVAVGVLLKDRSDHKASLRAERRTAYISFLRALSALHQCFVVKGKLAFNGSDEGSLESYMEEMYELKLALIGAQHEVTLVGSVAAAKAAEKVSTVQIDMDIAESTARKSGYDQKAWNVALLRSLHVQSTFQLAAIKDLRLGSKNSVREMALFFAENEQFLTQGLPGWSGGKLTTGPTISERSQRKLWRNRWRN